MEQPVPLYDAVLGGKVPVRTPEGTVSMTIPAGSSSGKVLRLKGRGAYANGKRGDLLAKLMIVLPEGDAALTKLAQKARDDGPIRPFRD
jgi:DnaJ-class molecular chaperone